jgi:hypothetical protein
MSADAEGVEVDHGVGEWPQGRGLVQCAVRPMLVEELFILAE